MGAQNALRLFLRALASFGEQIGPVLSPDSACQTHPILPCQEEIVNLITGQRPLRRSGAALGEQQLSVLGRMIFDLRGQGGKVLRGEVVTDRKDGQIETAVRIFVRNALAGELDVLQAPVAELGFFNGRI